MVKATIVWWWLWVQNLLTAQERIVFMPLALLLVMDHSPFVINSQHNVSKLHCVLEEQDQDLGRACPAWDEPSPGAVSSVHQVFQTSAWSLTHEE